MSEQPQWSPEMDVQIHASYMQVSQQLLDDYQMPDDWLGKLMRGEIVPVPETPLTRRQRLSRRWSGLRDKAGQLAYRAISGDEFPEREDW